MSTATESIPPDSAIFRSPEALAAAFEARLAELLQRPELGAFILVLANATADQALFDHLHDALAERFEHWCRCFDRADPAATGAAADDAAVFAGLRRLGFERLKTNRRRRAGPWELQFNPLRSLRPARMSAKAPAVSVPPFDPDGFHFDRPHLLSETLWEGELAGWPVRLLYNKFPFAERHTLLVPEPAAGRPQRLERAHHELAWQLLAQLGAPLPGVGLGFNAHGAFASVNHLHLQMFVRSDGRYPLEAPAWCHNGGALPYPLPVQRFTDMDQAWAALSGARSAYNLLYRPGVMYLVPRARQGSYRHSAWTAGFAWSELAGSITLSAEDAYQGLGQAEIEHEMRRLAPI